MDNKLERFFNKIGFIYNDDFNNSKITKVVVNKIEESWTVYIYNKNCLNIDSAMDLINTAKKGIESVSTIKIVYEYEEINDDDIRIYFKYLLNELIKNSPALSSIVNNEIYIDDDIITIEVISTNEE